MKDTWLGAVVQPGTTLGSRKYYQNEPKGNDRFLERRNSNIEGSNPSGPTNSKQHNARVANLDRRFLHLESSCRPVFSLALVWFAR